MNKIIELNNKYQIKIDQHHNYILQISKNENGSFRNIGYYKDIPLSLYKILLLETEDYSIGGKSITEIIKFFKDTVSDFKSSFKNFEEKDLKNDK